MANQIKLIVAIGVWVVLGILLYAKTFHAPFIFDDEILVVHNPYVQDLAHGLQSINNIYRYQHSRLLTNLTVALNFKAGQLDTFGYHVVNVLMHLIVTLGVWYLTIIVMRIKRITSSIDIPFWASLIFLVHPLHTESVSYINHRSSLLVTLFYVWSLIFYLLARTSKSFRQSTRLYVAAGITAVLSLLSKESGWTLPLIWVLADYLILNALPKRWAWAGLAVLVVGCIAIFDFKLADLLLTSVYSQSHRGDYLTLGTYLLTQLKVCIQLIKLTVLPVGLNADYDFPMARSLFEPQTLLAAVIMLGVVVSAHAWRYRCWYWSWCVGAFVISLLSHFFPVRYNVIAEHKMYLTIALMIPMIALWMHESLKQRFVPVCAGLVAIFAVLTIARNDVWANPVSLWQDTCLKSPLKPRPHLNLATALLKSGKVSEAEQKFIEVIHTAPEYVESYINLAQIATDRGDLILALALSDQAVRVNPAFDLAYLQNGFLNDRLGHREQAINSFVQWLKFHPDDRSIMDRVHFLQHIK